VVQQLRDSATCNQQLWGSGLAVQCNAVLNSEVLSLEVQQRALLGGSSARRRLEVLTDCPGQEAVAGAAACVHADSWGINLVCILRSHSSADGGGRGMPLA